MPPSERADVLLAMKEVASKIASVPVQFGIHDETCYWTAGYHLNIRIYEKLLFGMFDVLDEGQLIEVNVFCSLISIGIFLICSGK